MKADSKRSSEVPEIKPCRHMEQWVNSLADGSLTGFARWYTQLHIHGCSHCYAALEALQTLQVRLKALKGTESAAMPTTLSPIHRSALDLALEEVEKKRG